MWVYGFIIFLNEKTISIRKLIGVGLDHEESDIDFDCGIVVKQ